MQFVFSCLVAYCLLSSPLASFAQKAAEEVPSALPEEAAVANVAPALDEWRARPFTANYSLAPGGNGTTFGMLADPDPSVDPQANGNNGVSATSGYIFPSRAQMNRYWVRSIVGPQAFVRSTFRASWGTWVTNSPEEWEKDFSGWSKRFGTSLLGNTINTTSLVLLSGATHQDPMYYRCSCPEFWPRVRHAIMLTVVGRNRSGDAVFSPAKVISPFTGPMVTRNTIYPDRYNSGDAVVAGAYNLLGNAGWNLVREFIWKRPRW